MCIRDRLEFEDVARKVAVAELEQRSHIGFKPKVGRLRGRRHRTARIFHHLAVVVRVLERDRELARRNVGILDVHDRAEARADIRRLGAGEVHRSADRRGARQHGERAVLVYRRSLARLGLRDRSGVSDRRRALVEDGAALAARGVV